MDGLPVGLAEGTCDMDGTTLGCIDGLSDGELVGVMVGNGDGIGEGGLDGEVVGVVPVGEFVGAAEGAIVGGEMEVPASASAPVHAHV